MECNHVVVSIIIPTKNSAKAFEQCLDSIRKQTHRNIEIVVVDNYSTDNTVEIAKRYTDRIFSIGPERSTQVNYGVEKASGKYVYRVDSDFLLDPDIVTGAVNEAETKGHAAILIHNTSDPNVSFWSRVRKFERDMYASDELNVAVRFMRKDVFVDVGGFDPKLVAGEDYDLHNRVIAKYSIGKIDSKEIHLGEPRTLREIAQKHYYYGKTIALFLDKNKDRGMKQVSPLRMAYLRNYKEFFKHPLLACGFVIYQIVRYSSGALGIASARMHY